MDSGRNMTTITLNLSDDIRERLQVRARDEGGDLANIIQKLLEKGLQAERPLSPEQRVRELEEWVKSLPAVDVILDVSRESIYEGRGE